MLRLIIKGTKQEAILAAAAWHIRLSEPHEHHWNQSNYTLVETIALVDDAFTDRVVKWFAEVHDDAPFPIGTLLWYGDVGPDNRRKRHGHYGMVDRNCDQCIENGT